MAKFTKKPVTVEAITFQELVDHGRRVAPESINGGMPWSFTYAGHHISHENDTCYLIPTLEGTMKMGRDDMLITGVKGEIYPCKRDIFAATYEAAAPATSLKFGQALEAIQAGQRIARTGWNGKGMFVYFVPPASYPVQTGAAKEHFGKGAMVPYNAYMAIKNVDGTVSTWVPSVNDCLASDWGVVGESEQAASTVPPHQQRIIDEKAARDSEISRLAVFIDSNPVFPQLPADEQARLRRQLDVMRELSVVLGERIAHF